MTANDLVTEQVYYYADFRGPAVLEYVGSPVNCPHVYMFWNLGKAQARTLDAFEIQKGLFYNIDDCKQACLSELIRLAGILETKL